MKRISIIGFLMFLASSPWAVVLHVSPRGNDTWSGLISEPNVQATDGPLLSPARALAVARTLRPMGFPEHVDIRLASGEYRLSGPLVFYVCDSNLTMQPESGGAVTLTGGREIQGWTREGDLWWAPVREGWYFRWLSVDGEPRLRARLPDKGFFKHETRFDVQWKSTTGGEWGRPLTAEETGQMTYREGDLGLWLAQEDPELEIIHMWDESWVGVGSLDPKTRLVKFSNPTTHPPGAFDVHDYAVWNVKEGMNEPGKWCLDRKALQVWYKPLEGEDPTRLRVEAPTLDTLVRFEAYKDLPVSAVTIRGITLTLADAPLAGSGFGAMKVTGTIQWTHVKDCSLENLRICNAAGWGVQGMDMVTSTVRDCEINSLGGGGLHMAGTDNRAERNLVKDIGQLYRGAIGIYWEGKGGVIGHNEIERTPYDGIMCQASGTVMEKNILRRNMLELHDGAAIYIGFCKGTTIRGNDVRDVPDTGGYGSSAYYLDEQAEDCAVVGNLSVGVARPSQNHMARNNLIMGNLFVVEGDGRLCFARCSGYRVEGNVLAATGSWTFETPDEGVAAWPGNRIYSKTGIVVWKKLLMYQTVSTSPWKARDASRLGNPGLGDDPALWATPPKLSEAARVLNFIWLDAGRPRRTSSP